MRHLFCIRILLRRRHPLIIVASRIPCVLQCIHGNGAIRIWRTCSLAVADWRIADWVGLMIVVGVMWRKMVQLHVARWNILLRSITVVGTRHCWVMWLICPLRLYCVTLRFNHCCRILWRSMPNAMWSRGLVVTFSFAPFCPAILKPDL